MDKEKLREAVEDYSNIIKNGCETGENLRTIIIGENLRIIVNISKLYIAGSIGKLMSQKEIEKILWNLPKDLCDNPIPKIAEALCRKVPKRFESMTQIEIRDLCHKLICKCKLPIDEEATVVGVSIEIAKKLCKGKEKK